MKSSDLHVLSPTGKGPKQLKKKKKTEPEEKVDQNLTRFPLNPKSLKNPSITNFHKNQNYK